MQNRASFNMSPVENMSFFQKEIVAGVYLSSYANGNASQSEISLAFGVPLVSVKRACKKLRDEGAAGFFRPPVSRQGHKLTEQRLQEVQSRLDAGWEVPAIGVELGVLPNTIHKAIRAGRLKKKAPAR
jgi:transposase